MAKYKIPYPGLAESLIHLRKQVIHSLPYVVKNIPRFNTAEDIFNYCKSNYTFKSDPPGTELFQTVPTLLTDNDYGKPGEGDCDDATIFCLSVLLINGFDCGYVLAGRTKLRPTHIFAYCIDENGNKKVLDLTNKNFNQQRPYAFKQYIPFTISKNQLDMFLELADGGFRKFDGGFRKKRKLKLRKLTEQEKQNAIYLPSKQVFIPIEKFDNLHRQKAIDTMLSEGYDDQQLSEYLSGRAERKQRRELRMEKKKAKIEKTRAKTEIKKAKAQKKISQGKAKEVRAEAKRLKAERGESGGGAKLFNRAGDFIKNVMQPEEEQEEQSSEEQEQEFETPEVETESAEQESDESELNEGGFTMKDGISLGIFAIGFFLEKTKKVA